MRWNWSTTYLSLPDTLYARQDATPVTRPAWVVFNQELADAWGLGEPTEADLTLLAGNAPGPASFAQAYAGHQFGHPAMLGDGRALVLGEHLVGGRRVDVQLKGSGRTPYSRRGDGRAALGPMLREYVVGEALHALGIPTTRALAVVSTGEPVYRETPLPGAVLTRLASSHVRVGTFQFAAAAGEAELRALADYALARHYPALVEHPQPYAALLDAVVQAQASLVAQWMGVGFVHGVMNTDNMAISGQSIDFGPCAFLDEFRWGQVYSSIDTQGRYAYGNQPGIAQWNLTRLAEALVPLLDPDETRALEVAQSVIDTFPPRYQAAFDRVFGAKLGLPGLPDDRPLVDDVLAWMEEEGADFTATFRALTAGAVPAAPWASAWLRRRDEEASAHQRMARANPLVIARNHRVEAALAAATAGDLQPLETLVDALRHPFDVRPGTAELRPPPEVVPYVTFCGT